MSVSKKSSPSSVRKSGASRVDGAGIMVHALTLAVSKGRVLNEALPLLGRVGITLIDDPSSTRKLVLDTSVQNLKLLVIRSQDVPTFVRYASADLGIVGKDVLLEQSTEGLYEPLDLGIARCRMVVAAPVGAVDDSRRPRVATKYVNTANWHFARRGIQAEVVHLSGSMELAPITGLADRIVDLVDTGNTLKANGLVEIETIVDISSRLVVNKGSMKMKHAAVTQFIEDLRLAVRDHV